ncbi:MAG: serine--tRNA ligase, partial [Solirubrobacterales bacterium]
MLDIKLIRRQPGEVLAALARRDPGLVEVVEEILQQDQEWRAATSSSESLRAKQRSDSESIAAGKKAGADVSGLLAGMKDLSARVKGLTEQADRAKERLDALLLRLPNLPDPTAAPGPEDELVRVVGEVPALGFTARDHLELAGGRIDMDHAAKLSGARFAYLKGDLVLLELALVRWVLEQLRGHGFEPVIPPVLVRERALFGTGFLPDTEQQIYSLPEDELYLVGTSEVALASLHDEEILDAERLPLRYAGFSPCFRREAGAAGKDTRGIFRVHQFDKVEMFSFVEPPDSGAEHERILAIEEEILTALGLPYRIVNIAVNDLGASAAKKYDCEAWLPSQERYRELTSCSNTTDYQARRLNIRVRREKRDRPGAG